MSTTLSDILGGVIGAVTSVTESVGSDLTGGSGISNLTNSAVHGVTDAVSNVLQSVTSSNPASSSTVG
ncbi:MAG: hypothetical protein LBH31_03865, partial [Burkholderiaceae bacterium]|nr:hypothetical protein [Burkholderiaceae bacterium]